MSTAMSTPTSTAFRPAIMKDLIPTNISGAYLSPKPPDGFHPSTATAAAMIKHGFHWQRPGSDADPALRQMWDTHFGPGFSVGTWLVPDQVSHPDVIHRPRRKTGAGASLNEITNWGGCVLDGTWTSCVGTFTVPTVSQPSEAAGVDGGWDSSTWVGLDGGASSDDVLQCGVRQDVDGSGNASYYAWYEWYCGVQKQTLGETSPRYPAIASLNNILCVAWTGEGNNQINLIVSTDRGQTFVSKHVSSQLSPAAPALCAHDGNMFISWVGVDNYNVNIAQIEFDGNGNPTAIRTPVVLNSISPQAPSMASLNGNLYVGFVGKDNDQINIVVSTDGGASFPVGYKHISSETSPYTPALAANAGLLMVAWKGDGNDQLNVAQCTLSGPAVTAIVSKQVLGDTSPLGPSLVSIGSTLYLGWRSDGSDTLNIMYSTDNGATFGNKYVSGETSSDAPMLAAYNSDLFISWKGDGNDNLNVSLVGIVNGTINGFSTPDYRNEIAIPNFAVTPGDQVTGSAQYTANKAAGQVSFSNVTTNVKFSITLVPPPGATMSGDTAEWVVEVPTKSNVYTHLPSFSTVSFTGASACGTTLGNPQSGAVDVIESDSGAALTSTTLGNSTVTISYV